MSNSPLVNYTLISPNRNSPRAHKIDRITIHCVVGQCTVEALGQWFYPTDRQASSNYGVGYDGRIGMYVEEKDRSWCSSSPDNDHRAVTIEVASDTYDPYAVTNAALESTIKLVADICIRNGIRKLIWINNSKEAQSYKLQKGEAIMTLHRWFTNTFCPGNYLISKHEEIARRVNEMIGYPVYEKGQKITLNEHAHVYHESREFSAWAYEYVFTVLEQNGDRLVFVDDKGVVQGAVDSRDVSLWVAPEPAPEPEPEPEPEPDPEPEPTPEPEPEPEPEPSLWDKILETCKAIIDFLRAIFGDK